MPAKPKQKKYVTRNVYLGDEADKQLAEIMAKKDERSHSNMIRRIIKAAWTKWCGGKA